MQRFEFNDGTSSKFWEIEQQGCDLNVRFGKIGTAGQTQAHPDEAKAAAALAKLIKEKTGKGYIECGAATPAAPAAAPRVKAAVATPVVAAPIAAPIAPAPAPAAPLALNGDMPPWEAAGPVIDIPPELAARAMPSRARPGPPPSTDAQASWDAFLKFARELTLDQKSTSKQYAAAVKEAVARIEKGTREGSLASDVILLGLQAGFDGRLKPGQGSPFVDYLVASRGLPYAIEVLLAMQQGSIRKDYGTQKTLYFVSETRWDFGGENDYSDTELAFRAHLAVADAALWQQCADTLRAALPQLDERRRPLVAVLLPELPEIANELALSIRHMPYSYAWLLLTASAGKSLDALQFDEPDREYRHLYYPSAAAVMTLVVERGVDAVRLLAPGAFIDATAKALACIGTPASMKALALACNMTKESLKRLTTIAQRWPLAAIAALSELIAAGANCPPAARGVLTMLAHANADALPAFRPWLSEGAMKVIDSIAAGFGAELAIADAADLPGVLVAPPWSRPAKKAAAAFSLEPLPLAPVERWHEDEREELLATFRPSHRHTREALRTDPDAMAEEIGHYSKPVAKQIAAAVAAGDGAQLIAVHTRYAADGGHQWLNGNALANLPEPMAVAVWNGAPLSVYWDQELVVGTLGLLGLPGLKAVFDANPARYFDLALYFGAVELAPVAARVFGTMKTRDTRAMARAWLLANPEHAACALIAPALGKAGTARACAGAALRLLAAAGHADLLMEVAQRYRQAPVTAAMRAMLDEDPLDIYPAKIGKLPDFWQPLSWTRPVLKSNGKAVPDSSLEDIGIMLRFPSADGVYAGVTQLKDACTSASLADFAWDAFRAWIDAGGESKENWAFTALGLLGNDDTARKLTPLIRAWPGEAQHARAVTGLDVLAAIGSDTALMLLNGIAQKIKFKGLQDKAREKIAAIAEARELTTEELEDRLAPDLGLDDNGSLLLDFGPRQFQVGFDEALKPFVRDSEGARLPDLPKPKKTDDEALSDAAVERYKALKKDARMIASQQVLRLDIAMCARRRWTPEVFRTFLAGHPLVRHLVQRIVWGVYRVDDGASYGGQLLACFRATPDGACTDAGDDSFEVPAGDDIRIGIPHPLELPAADAAAFGQLFADYELLQPFAQIGRETYALTSEELQADALTRWEGTQAPTGRVLGLANKGWRRGDPQDGGGIDYFTKALGPDRVIVLFMDPGIIVGMMDENPEHQDLLKVVTGHPARWGGIDKHLSLSTIDPIAASELIRDLEALRL